MASFLHKESDYRHAEFASAFDEVSCWSSRFGHLLFEHIELRGGIEILDLGCGTGFPLFELAQTFGATCRVTGIDVWKQGLDRARFKLAFHDLPYVEIFEVDGASQPFADDRFDLIVSNLGVNNFAEPEAVLTECRRVAKPEGKLVLTTNLKGHYREFYEVFQSVLAGNFEALARLYVHEEHRGTRVSVNALLERCGWRQGKVVEAQFQHRFVDGSALLNHSLTRFGFLPGWRNVVDPTDEEAIFDAIERALNDVAREQGGLTMTVPMLYLEAMNA